MHLRLKAAKAAECCDHNASDCSAKSGRKHIALEFSLCVDGWMTPLALEFLQINTFLLRCR